MKDSGLVPRVSSLFTFLARRFVAGETAQEALAAAQKVNAQGMNAILDYLGEDVSTEANAEKAVDEYMKLLRQIADRKIRAAISLKVSQMGMLVSRDVCLKNLKRLAEQAARLNIMIWFDMEGSRLTQKTIEVFDALREDFKNIALCVQAYLVRTGGDLDQLMRRPLNVRLCKGAYKEPPTIAYRTRQAVNGNYRVLAQKLLQQAGRRAYPAFATHDEELIQFIQTQARERGLSKELFEFQMLYGIQNQELAALAKDGYRTSVYIPGTHWFPYFVRRLRERKENVYFLMRNLFRA